MDDIKQYAKDILKMIATTYDSELGNDNIQLLYQLLNNEFIVFDNNSEENYKMKMIEDRLYINLESQKYKTNPSLIKEDLIHELFHIFINPDKEEADEKLKEFYHFLTEGLVESFSKRFCEKNNIKKEENKQYKANVEFVNTMINVLPDEASKEKMVFQYPFSYILEYCQIATEHQSNYGINFYSRWDKHYLKNIDYTNILKFLTDTYPKQNDPEEINLIIEQYRENGTIENARSNLTSLYERLYGNNPIAIENIKKEIDKVFEGNYVGHSQNKGTSRILAPAGYFEGTIIVLLSVILGATLAWFLIQ